MMSRLDRNFIGRWWFETDHHLFFISFALFSLGIIAVFSVSPYTAQALTRGDTYISPYYFIWMHVIYTIISIFLLLLVSAASLAQVRIGGFILLCVIIGVMLLMFIMGAFGGDVTNGFFSVQEVKGSTRWVRIGGRSVQPAEFLKPAFIITLAILLARIYQHRQWHGADYFVVFLLLGAFGCMVFQRDYSQIFLLLIVTGSLFIVLGYTRLIVGFLALCAGAAIFLYWNVSYVRERVDYFFSEETPYQVGRALDAIQNGGIFGMGLGNGRIKQILPEAHTDYVFAIFVEEFGLLSGIIILGIYFYFIRRVFLHIAHQDILWVRLAIIGLSALITFQAALHIAVNLNFFPVTGVTLPFISYGGSSLFACSLSFGAIIALTRLRKQDMLA